MQLSKYYNTRIDVTFDPYHDKSIKGTESSRGAKSSDILIKVIRTDKLLPIEIEKFGPFQKTKYHSNSFSLNGFRQTAVIIKVFTLEDHIKKMETSAYWYPMLKKKSQKEP